MGIQYNKALFEETLYFTGDEVKVEISPDSPNFVSFKGENKKNILIIYRSVDGQKLPETENGTLSKLVTAIHCKLEDVVLIDYNELIVKKYTRLKKSFKPRIVMLFGISCDEISIHITTENYKPVEFDGTIFITSKRLDQLNDIQKGHLWKALKQVFNISI
ncbi:MAG: hypothetical protein ACKVPJ_00525 [Chitinophagales bacterium]